MLNFADKRNFRGHSRIDVLILIREEKFSAICKREKMQQVSINFRPHQIFISGKTKLCNLKNRWSAIKRHFHRPENIFLLQCHSFRGKKENFPRKKWQNNMKWHTLKIAIKQFFASNRNNSVRLKRDCNFGQLKPSRICIFDFGGKHFSRGNHFLLIKAVFHKMLHS